MKDKTRIKYKNVIDSYKSMRGERITLAKQFKCSVLLIHMMEKYNILLKDSNTGILYGNPNYGIHIPHDEILAKLDTKVKTANLRSRKKPTLMAELEEHDTLKDEDFIFNYCVNYLKERGCKITQIKTIEL